MPNPSPHIHQSSRQAWRGLVLIGGGGHALVVAEAAFLAKVPVVGCLDDRLDREPPAAASLGIPRLASLAEGLRDLAAADGSAVGYILAVGSLPTRRNLLPHLPQTSPSAVTIVHPAACISPTAVVGRGVYVGPRTVIHSAARIADHAIINTGAIVEHECEIGENAHIAPGAVLGGNVSIGADTLVGLGSRVLPGVRIGAGCTIGAGAVVIRDVEEGATVVGVPAAVLARAR